MVEAPARVLTSRVVVNANSFRVKLLKVVVARDAPQRSCEALRRFRQLQFDAQG